MCVANGYYLKLSLVAYSYRNMSIKWYFNQLCAPHNFVFFFFFLATMVCQVIKFVFGNFYLNYYGFRPNALELWINNTFHSQIFLSVFLCVFSLSVLYSAIFEQWTHLINIHARYKIFRLREMYFMNISKTVHSTPMHTHIYTKHKTHYEFIALWKRCWILILFFFVSIFFFFLEPKNI